MLRSQLVGSLTPAAAITHDRPPLGVGERPGGSCRIPVIERIGGVLNAGPSPWLTLRPGYDVGLCAGRLVRPSGTPIENPQSAVGISLQKRPGIGEALVRPQSPGRSKSCRPDLPGQETRQLPGPSDLRRKKERPLGILLILVLMTHTRLEDMTATDAARHSLTVSPWRWATFHSPSSRR